MFCYYTLLIKRKYKCDFFKLIYSFGPTYEAFDISGFCYM